MNSELPGHHHYQLCCFLMASISLISPLSQQMWSVVIRQTNLINWISMKHLFHGVVECVQENSIMVRYGIMNRFVYSFHEEMSIFSLICICLLMQQNS